MTGTTFFDIVVEADCVRDEQDLCQPMLEWIGVRFRVRLRDRRRLQYGCVRNFLRRFSRGTLYLSIIRTLALETTALLTRGENRMAYCRYVTKTIVKSGRDWAVLSAEKPHR